MNFWTWCSGTTAFPRCYRQYWIPLEQEQREAHKPSLHWGQVHPDSGSSPVVINKWHQGWLSKAIANFSDPIWILSRSNKIWHVNIGVDGVFLKKIQVLKKVPWLPYSLSLNCVKKTFEKKLTQNFLRFFFMRKRTSWICIFLVFRPRQKWPPVCDKIRKYLLSQFFHVSSRT